MSTSSESAGPLPIHTLLDGMRMCVRLCTSCRVCLGRYHELAHVCLCRCCCSLLFAFACLLPMSWPPLFHCSATGLAWPQLINCSGIVASAMKQRRHCIGAFRAESLHPTCSRANVSQASGHLSHLLCSVDWRMPKDHGHHQCLL